MEKKARKFTVNSEGALNEISRFFGGWKPTLRELLQNAYRAGAQTVQVTASANGAMVEIHDDGCGCSYERLGILLEAFQSGWEQGRVVKPAGLGFYSVFNPEIIDEVEVRSADWMIRRKNGLPMSMGVEEIYPLETVSGFTVRILAKTAHEELEDEIIGTRGLYPFQVILNGKEIKKKRIDTDLEIEIAGIGKIGWKGDYPKSRRDELCEAIWEYSEIRSAVLDRAVTEGALEKMPKELKKYAEVISEQSMIYWWIDPVCGVTPRLPDRSELEDNLKLEAAARTILKELATKVRELALVEVRDYPLRFTSKAKLPVGRGCLAKYTNIALEDAGWSHVRVSDLAEMSTYCVYEGDGWSLDMDEYERVEFWDRSPYTARKEDRETLGQAFGLELIERGFRIDAEATPISFKGLRKPKEGHFIAVAQAIEWNGVQLPFYLIEEEDQREIFGEAYAVVSGGWARAAKMMRGSGEDWRPAQIVMAFIARSIQDKGEWGDICSDEWVEYDEEGGVKWETVRQDLIRDMLEDFAGREELRLFEQKTRIEQLMEKASAAKEHLTCWRNQRDAPTDKEFSPAIKAIDIALVNYGKRRGVILEKLAKKGIILKEVALAG